MGRSTAVDTRDRASWIGVRCPVPPYRPAGLPRRAAWVLVVGLAAACAGRVARPVVEPVATPPPAPPVAPPSAGSSVAASPPPGASGAAPSPHPPVLTITERNHCRVDDDCTLDVERCPICPPCGAALTLPVSKTFAAKATRICEKRRRQAAVRVQRGRPPQPTADCPPCREQERAPRSLRERTGIRCVYGACVNVVVDQPLPQGPATACASPDDCADRRCTVGDPAGCTARLCCDPATCRNACRGAQDCPACRPSCVDGTCQ